MSRELPILFNGDMVRAILDGRKTVTRRLVKPQPTYRLTCGQNWEKLLVAAAAPYQPGDILYVRETWKCWRAHRYEATADIMFRAGGDGVQLQFANGRTDSIDRIDYDTFVNKWFSHNGEWKPSLFMPKEAARIWLKVKDVRVERLQDITEEQAKAEGAIDNRGFIHSPDNEYDSIHTAKQYFEEIWNSTIKKSDLDRYGWDANPWVWVVEFEMIETK